MGAANGLLAGMTGSFGVPSMMYIQGIGLERDQLFQGSGILLTASTIALAFAVGSNILLAVELGIASLFAALLAFIDLWVGQNLRQCLPEVLFRRV